MRHRVPANLVLVLVTLLALAGVAGLARPSRPAPAVGGSPLISSDPQANAADVYAFVSPDAPGSVTIIADFYPAPDPAGDPTAYRFGDDVRYNISIDNTGDARADVTYQFRFSTALRDPNSVLYASGPITSLDSPNWNVRQFYAIYQINAQNQSTQIAEGPQVPPPNLGPAMTPNYEQLAETAVTDVNGIKVFAGPRADPAFADLRRLNDLLTLPGPVPTDPGVDSLDGINVLSIAMQIPIGNLTADGSVPRDPKDPHAILGIWATANRQVPAAPTAGSPSAGGALVQTSRAGVPFVNQLMIPVGARETFDASAPAGDAQFLPSFTNPELPPRLASLHGLKVPQGDRNDLVALYLTGIPGLNQPASVVPAEMLRLNVAVPPAAQPNRLGVLAGDVAGFPNGRRLTDDVVDIELRALVGLAADKSFDVAPNNLLGDGVDANPIGFLPAFPYVAPPALAPQTQSQSRTAGAIVVVGASTPASTPVPEPESVTVPLRELNGSGASGTAVLTAEGNKTRVVITSHGAAGGNPTHIHRGTCNNLDPNPLYPLNDIAADGKSDTTINVRLDDLRSGQYAINVHKSSTDLGTYIMCGDIPRSGG